MSCCDSNCLLLAGQVYIGECKTAGGWGLNYGGNWGGGKAEVLAGLPLGNASAFDINIDSDQQVVVNRNGLTFDAGCGVTNINGMTFDMTLQCMSMENLARFMYGTVTEKFNSGDPVVDACVTSCCGAFKPCEHIKFRHPLVDVSSVVIKRGDTLAVLVENEDYTVDQTGFTMINGFSTELLVSYNWGSGSYKVVQPFVQKEREYSIYFKGFNRADTSDMYLVKINRVKVTPLNTFTLISEDFQNISLSGIILADKTVPSGVSPYFTIEKVRVP